MQISMYDKLYTPNVFIEYSNSGADKQTQATH